MFEGLIAKLALGAVWGRVKSNAAHDWQAIPPKARLWLIGIIVVILAAIAHQWYAHHVLNEARAVSYKAGYDQAVKDINAAEAKKVAPIVRSKTETDAKNAAFDEGVKKNHDTQDAHISSNVDALLLGLRNNQAAGRIDVEPGAGMLGADVTAGALRTAASANDGLAAPVAANTGADPQGAGDDVYVLVPAKQLYVRSGQCDRDYTALTSWEDKYQNYMDNYNEWLAKTRKVTAKH